MLVNRAPSRASTGNVHPARFFSLGVDEVSGMSSRPQFLAIVLLSLGVVSMPVHADLKPATKTVPQPESPISITSYDAQYYESVSSRLSDGIRHQVRYENRSDRLVTAVEFGLVAALVTLAAVIAFASMGPRLGF